MAAQELDPLDEILQHIKDGNNFVLQGGAGSGKTETLKRVVQDISKGKSPKKIVCITHTNKAADQIAERISRRVAVSTIHTFLGALIRPYKANIKVVLPEIFILPYFERRGEDEDGPDEKSKKKSEKDRFNKAHTKLETRRLSVLNCKTEKVVGKPAYDKYPDIHVTEHNSLVDQVNAAIKTALDAVDPSSIEYNETPFDSFKDASYSHDGLIQIAGLLIGRYPSLRKIISDKYDCIFIDEYQDTHEDVIKSLVQVSTESDLCLGLFGDSEQAIYEDGIGDVWAYIKSGDLNLVKKKDNYRCSQSVIDVANTFRCDGLEQEVALKTKGDGTLETDFDREGSAKLCYAMAPVPPTKEPREGETKTEAQERYKKEREQYKIDCVVARDNLVAAVAGKHPNFTQLKLTNKSIAADVGFSNLWEIFDDNFFDPREQMKKVLKRLQFEQLFELIELYRALPGDRRAFNKLIAIINHTGTSIENVKDKISVSKDLDGLSDPNLGAYEAIQIAIDKRFISKSDGHKSYLSNRDSFQTEFEMDKYVHDFRELVDEGNNTKVRMAKALKAELKDDLTVEVVEEQFEALERKSQKFNFYKRFFSDDLKVHEILKFYEYEIEDGSFATMHKTKGTGIENVIVVCEEYGWSKYDFTSCFSGEAPKTPREVQSRKLLYVACSRTKLNLAVVRLVTDDKELDYLKTIFSKVEEVTVLTQSSA